MSGLYIHFFSGFQNNIRRRYSIFFFHGIPGFCLGPGAGQLFPRQLFGGYGSGAGGHENSDPCPKCPDPAEVVLMGLEDKKKALMAEEEALKRERKSLEKFKEELDESLEKLDALKKQIQDDLARIQQVKSDQELAEEKAREEEF
ncbi:MAG: hypothetical protein HQK66_12750 [Desulfamplus sp.]|nr:hypothetical protein [Desulfamplus sp.]